MHLRSLLALPSLRAWPRKPQIINTCSPATYLCWSRSLHDGLAVPGQSVPPTDGWTPGLLGTPQLLYTSVHRTTAPLPRSLAAHADTKYRCLTDSGLGAGDQELGKDRVPQFLQVTYRAASEARILLDIYFFIFQGWSWPSLYPVHCSGPGVLSGREPHCQQPKSFNY